MSLTTIEQQKATGTIEPSIVTEFPHDWSIVGPGFEPIVLAHRALTFHAQTRPAEVTALHDELYGMLNTLIETPQGLYGPDESNFAILSEDACAVLTSCVKNLANQQPAILALTKDFTHFAGFAALAQLYDGRIPQTPPDNQPPLPTL